MEMLWEEGWKFVVVMFRGSELADGVLAGLYSSWPWREAMLGTLS